MKDSLIVSWAYVTNACHFLVLKEQDLKERPFFDKCMLTQETTFFSNDLLVMYFF